MIPQSVYVSSKQASWSVESLQERFLQNEVYINNFDSFLGSARGQRYFKGVLSAMQNTMVEPRVTTLESNRKTNARMHSPRLMRELEVQRS